MNIVFFCSDKQREAALGTSFCKGAKLHGHTVQLIKLGEEIPVNIDLACMVGVKSRHLWYSLRRTKPDLSTLMFDKGYSRHKKNGHWEYWRVSSNSHNPTTLDITYPSDRFNSLDFTIKPWRKKGDHILLAGSSSKYHAFYNMLDPTNFAKKIVKNIRKQTNRSIVYRPKPSWKEAVPIKGTTYSNGRKKDSILEAFNNCHVLVTHGSNACFEAALNGVPSIIIGTGVMRNASSVTLHEINAPICNSSERLKIFNALAYHQWTLDEFESGEAFKTIGGWLCE